MASSPKRARTKAPKGRPASTSQIGHPVVEHTALGSGLAIKQQPQPSTPAKRYAEPSTLAIHSGLELAHDQDMDDSVPTNIEGNLDVDLAEMSLGQRLTALSGVDDPLRASTPDSDDKEGGPSTILLSSSHTKSRKGKNIEVMPVPTNSLTRTLIQALHSNDSRLLETCLAHSDTQLIRATVRRLPPQLAVPLISACVDRMGRGARAGNMKGGGGGASSQRAAALLGWVMAVLAVHSGHLMTMPDLVARLAALHATLTTRLTLQQSLLSLSGRLDLVLLQMEMRSSAAPAPLPPLTNTKKKGKKGSKEAEKDVRRYVEGESSEDDQNAEVEVEVGSDVEGSIEDVELGGDSDGDDDDDDDDEDGEEANDSEDSEDSSNSAGGVGLNGFIDDEAEEYTDEDEYESE